MNIGRKIYGYCNGFFGRDSFDEKIIIGEGYDRIVVQEGENKLFTTFKDKETKQEKIEDWAQGLGRYGCDSIGINDYGINEDGTKIMPF